MNGWRRAAALLLLLSLLFTLCACPAQDEDEAPLILRREAGGALVCDDTGVAYRRLPDTYLPGSMAKKPYATYENQNGVVEYFHQLGPESAGDYLVAVDPDETYPRYMLCSLAYDMPSLAEMDPNEVWICGAEEAAFWVEANIIDKMLLSARVDRVVEAYQTGDRWETLPSGTPEVCVQLIFRSPFYTEFYYYCTYYSFGPGACFLYEFETGYCMRVPDDLFTGYDLYA